MMPRHALIYISRQSCSSGLSGELEDRLRRSVEAQGDVVLGACAEHTALIGRGRIAGWKSLLAGLDGIDVVVVASAGDLPGRSVKDLLAILGHLRGSGVGLHLVAEGIDTATAPAVAMLDLIDAYRRAKLSQAIKSGQAKAIAAGKKIGRPEVPECVRQRIRAALAGGGGIRSTARRFNVSGGTVINIMRSIARAEVEAA